MARDIIDRLERIERKLDLLLLDAGVEGQACPHCGSDQVQDTSTATVQRVTCLTCGRSTPSEEEALSG